LQQSGDRTEVWFPEIENIYMSKSRSFPPMRHALSDHIHSPA
jgi:hypothetical protein